MEIPSWLRTCNPKSHLNMRDLAATLKCSSSHVYNLVQEGILPPPERWDSQLAQTPYRKTRLQWSVAQVIEFLPHYEPRPNRRPVPVRGLSPAGEEMLFPSECAAAHHIGRSHTAVHSVLAGKRSHAAGWRFSRA